MADSQRICSVDGCNNFANRAGGGAKGFCAKHYRRFAKHGDTSHCDHKKSSRIDFVRNVAAIHTGPDCLIWPFGKKPRTCYPIIRTNGKPHIVSRLVCELVNGPAPSDNHHAAHSCGNGHLGCVSGSHLTWKTPTENQQDRFAHGTSSRGERNPNTILTEQDVTEIRKLHGVVTQRDLAIQFGVSRTTIQNIHYGKYWGWLT